LEVKTPEDLRRLMVIADGGDPDAQQTLNAFLRFNNIVERSNLPTRRDVVLLTYLDGCSKRYYPNNPDNPFASLRDSLATSFMAKGGGKSNQFVELMKQTPSLSDLQTVSESNPSLTDRILGRGKTE
jgi:hypothetical protein